MTTKAEDMSVSRRYTGETLLRYTVIGFRVVSQDTGAGLAIQH